ncbi:MULTISPECIES: hypothetical protein [unclassified Candidatus Tisiphia]|uniref:hypothetical protein n=1 Tax=unclassified Candidatus Tisiphia TaxID=2996318 RepID=UPI0035C8B585
MIGYGNRMPRGVASSTEVRRQSIKLQSNLSVYFSQKKTGVNFMTNDVKNQPQIFFGNKYNKLLQVFYY